MTKIRMQIDGKTVEMTAAEYRAELDRRAVDARKIAAALRGGNITACTAAQKAMQQKYA